MEVVPIPTPTGADWLTTGNIASGAVLGTLNNASWSFIASGTRRGGFHASGERGLQTHGTLFQNSELIELTSVLTTTDGSPQVLFAKTLDDPSVWSFASTVQARRSSGIDRAVFERKVMSYREGGPALLGKEHAVFTDKTASYMLQWQVSINDIMLVVQGLAGHQVYWTAQIQYQGVSTNI
jgi:hypothetical protein